jgi:hypothetical protein
MTFIGTNKRGDKVKISPIPEGGFTISLIAKNGTGWASPADTVVEAKAKAEQALGPLTWQER